MSRIRRAAAIVTVVLSAAGCGTAEPSLSDLPATVDRPEPTPAPLTATSAPTSTPTAGPAPLTTAPLPRPAPKARPGRPWSVVVTFYGSADNDPPGSTAIAHPNARHTEAGGTGTYADPLSLAADTRAIAVGSRVYYPPLRKYFVMEDDCAGCIDDWESSRIPHIDLWTGDHAGSAFLACEEALTPPGRVTVEVNPPPGRSVDTHPLFSGSGCLL